MKEGRKEGSRGSRREQAQKKAKPLQLPLMLQRDSFPFNKHTKPHGSLKRDTSFLDAAMSLEKAMQLAGQPKTLLVKTRAHASRPSRGKYLDIYIYTNIYIYIWHSVASPPPLPQ